MWPLAALCLALLALLAILSARALAPRRALAYEPAVVGGILTPAECDLLVARATPMLQRSQTLAGVSGARTSEQAWLDVTDGVAGDVVKKVRARTAQLVGVYREDLFEQMQVVRYVPGQEYRPHHDACVAECAREARIPRRATLLVYLTDDFDAGSTYFPKIDARYKPKRGDGVLFYNADADTGAVLDASLHAGEPVSRGTKWVANCWVRYDPAAPRA
jgi:prolyl 4-hydroxylase